MELWLSVLSPDIANIAVACCHAQLRPTHDLHRYGTPMLPHDADPAS